MNSSRSAFAPQDTVASFLKFNDEESATQHLMAAYLSLEPKQFRSFVDQVKEITERTSAPNLNLVVNYENEVEEIRAKPDDVTSHHAGSSLFSVKGASRNTWHSATGQLSDPSLERMAVFYGRPMSQSTRTELVSGALSIATDGMPPDKVKMLWGRIQVLNKASSKYPVTDSPLPSNIGEKAYGKYTDIGKNIQNRDLDGVRVDVAEQYLVREPRAFETMKSSINHKLPAYSTIGTKWYAGNLTEATVYTGGSYEPLLRSRPYNPRTPALEDAELESVAVKYTNLLSQFYPHQTSKALLKVAQSLPDERAKVLLDRVVQINSERRSIEPCVPAITIRYKDSNGDGIEELDSFGLKSNLKSAHWNDLADIFWPQSIMEKDHQSDI